MTGAENEEVAFVLKVLDQEKTQAALEKARASAKGMTDEQKSSALAAADAARRQADAQQLLQRHISETTKRQNELRTAVFQTLEIFNRVTGMIRSAAQVIQDLAERTQRTSREFDGLQTATDRVADEFVRGLDEGAAFSNLLRGMAGDVRGTEDAARTAGVAISELADALGRVNRVAAAIQSLGLSELVRGIGNTAAGAERFLVSGTQMAGGTSTQGLAYLPPEEVLARPGSGMGDHGRGSSLWNDTPRRRGGGGGGGAGAAPRYDEYGPSMEEFLEAIAREGEAWAELNRQRREGEDEVAAARMSAAESEAQAIQDEKSLEEEAHRLRLEWAAEEKAQQQQIRDYTREQVIGSVQAFASMAQVGSGIFTQLAAQQEQQINNITSVLQASGTSQASIERATSAQQDRLDRLKKAEGGFLIAYNAVMGATSTAESIRSFAKLDLAAGFAHAAAAAGYFAAAAMAGIRLGDDGSGGGGSAAPTIATPSYSTRAAETGPGENMSTNLTIFTWGYSNSGLGRQVERARFEYERSGGDADMLAGASGYGE